MKGALTLITSTKPAHLGKCYSLKDGKLSKSTSGELSEGSFEVLDFADSSELAGVLASVRTDQAMMASLPVSGLKSGRIVTKGQLGTQPGAVARTKEHWHFPPRPGALVLDFDPVEGGDLSRDALWSLLLSVVPSLAGAGVLWWCSGSSHIFNDGREVQGLKGQRLYVLIEDLSDTERVGDVLAKRLWLAGYGRVEISASGSKLLRTVFDEAMFQPARLDFCGGAVCEPPLNQRRGSPVVLSGGGFWDSRAGLPDLSPADEAKVAGLIAADKDKAEPDAMVARERWKMERHPELMARHVRAGVPAQEASERATRTLESALSGVLLGDYEVVTADGQRVTVGDLLDNRERWHGVELLDPVEPGRRGGAPCAKFFAWGAVPTIHSFGRGGSTFKLRRQPARFYVTKGSRAELASQLLAELGKQPDIFIKGGSVCMVNGDAVRVLDRHGLAHELGLRCAFYVKTRTGDSATDLPSETIEQILAIAPTMRARELKALALLPFARPDGTLVLAPGFDAQTGVFGYFDAEGVGEIPDKPTDNDIVRAIRAVWRPYEAYQFATDDDKAGAFAALMTAVIRPALEIAPGFLYDAPGQASGKTRGALVCGAILRGRRGGSTPFVGGAGADAELSKKLVSIARSGEAFCLIDNVVGHWKSAVLSSLLTDGVLNDRVLGSNTWYQGPARLLLTASSNNASIDADLQTRLVRVRIDPRCERPQAREFAFEPVSRALAERLEIARGVLTLVRAHRVAGAPAVLAGGTRFEEWAGVVRQPIGWLQSRGYFEAAGVGDVGDPAASLLESASVGDPEIEALGMLLNGVDKIFDGEPFLTRDLLPFVEAGRTSSDEGKSLLCAGVEGLIGLDKLTSTRLGHALRHRRDRHVDGLVLRACVGKNRNGMSFWRVSRT